MLMGVLAGCTDPGRSVGRGNESTDASGSELGLVAALSRVRATESTRRYVEYGNLGATRVLAEADRARFTNPVG